MTKARFSGPLFFHRRSFVDYGLQLALLLFSSSYSLQPTAYSHTPQEVHEADLFHRTAWNFDHAPILPTAAV